MTKTVQLACASTFLWLSACASTPPPPAQRPPALAPPASPAITAPPEAMTPKDTMIASEDGKVRVPRLGDGWACGQRSVSTQGVDATLIQCRRADVFFTLTAKDYSVAPEDVLPVEALFRGPFRNNYKRLFTDIRVTREGPTSRDGQPGYEIRFEATSGRGPIRWREQAMTSSNHVLLLTADGIAEAFDRFGADVERWFQVAEFGTLKAERRAGLQQPVDPVATSGL